MDWSKIENELKFTTSRSAGPGGQNVNKTNSKVTVNFEVATSAGLSEEEKTLVLSKLHSRISSDGSLIVSSQEKRSQLSNKETAVEKLKALLLKALTRKKLRRTSKPTKASVEKRIRKKKQHSEKKQRRRDAFD